MLIKCKIGMRKNTFHTFRKPESFFLTCKIYYTFFLQTRMSCHCLWSNFLYGHFCLLRFSTLIRLGRSKIREILTEYIAPPASRGRHKIIRAHDLKCIFQIFLIPTTSHSYTSGSTAKPRNSTSSWFVKADVRMLDTSPEWILVTQLGCDSFAFWKNCRNKTQDGCVKVKSITYVKFIDMDSLHLFEQYTKFHKSKLLGWRKMKFRDIFADKNESGLVSCQLFSLLDTTF